MSDRLLFWISGSAPCWRVMAVLKEKGLEFESKLLNASKGELKSEPVLALNPRGQVPTFKDGDIVVNESIAAMQYLEENYPAVPLLPNEKAARALALQRFHEVSSLYSAIQPLFYAKMVGKVNTDAEKEQFATGLEKGHKELSYFEGYLSDRQFLIGEIFTLADINLATALFFAQRAGATLEKYPNLKKYLDSLRDRPCFKDTWPPHWLETEDKDWLVGL